MSVKTVSSFKHYESVDLKKKAREGRRHNSNKESPQKTFKEKRDEYLMFKKKRKVGKSLSENCFRVGGGGGEERRRSLGAGGGFFRVEKKLVGGEHSGKC
jgi:hypothetical protein